MSTASVGHYIENDKIACIEKCGIYGAADLFDFSSQQRSGGLDLSGGNSWVF
ncbi:Unknown protein sequence [Pseudomonas syringae pv. syringae]|nr:Unknown protein sequence [Pseudomonas syringae pv. syringae]